MKKLAKYYDLRQCVTGCMVEDWCLEECQECGLCRAWTSKGHHFSDVSQASARQSGGQTSRRVHKSQQDPQLPQEKPQYHFISSRKIKEMAYKSYVHPALEYAYTVWDPYTQQHINHIEAIQR